MHYRPEVDGLRALAVLPVLFFHADFSPFSGGYVGVDVFFVISGYLIASIILEDQKAGRFSLLRFYERRARRILPALFLVIAVSIPVAFALLLPQDLASFSQSVVATVLFFSNFHFWRESGYFDTAVELKPLLHTWSLAVEEQFYIFFPILLTFLQSRLRKFAFAILAIATLGSLALAQWGSLAAPAATFFSLPTRAWELFLGALLAYFHVSGHRVPPSRLFGEIGAGVGLVAIFYSIFSFDSTTPFPGIYALVPTVGTVLVLGCATSQTIAGRLLALKPIVGIGLISYSAYLWHQPLLAFARYYSLDGLSNAQAACLIVLTFALSYLSWRFVEAPFRRRGAIPSIRIPVFAVSAAVLLLSVGYIGYASRGTVLHSEKWLQQAAIVEHGFQRNFGLNSACDIAGKIPETCISGDDPQVLLWGDSNAMHLAQALIAARPGLKMAQATFSGCGPILDIAPIDKRFDRRWSRECIKANDEVMSFVRATPSLKYAILGSAFGQYVGPSVSIMTRQQEVRPTGSFVLESFLKTIEVLRERGIVPIVISPTPQNGRDIGHCLSRALMLGIAQETCNFALADAQSHQRHILAFLKRLESQGVRVLFLTESLCANGVCSTTIDGLPIYRDHGHFSQEGSAKVGQTIRLDRLIFD